MMLPPSNAVITLEKAQECAFSDGPQGAMRMAPRENPSCLEKPSEDGFSRLDDELKAEGGSQ